MELVVAVRDACLLRKYLYGSVDIRYGVTKEIESYVFSLMGFSSNFANFKADMEREFTPSFQTHKFVLMRV